VVQLTSGGNYSIYVRCVDDVGNANVAEYAVQFMVSDEPDLTAPVISGSSISTESYVTAGQDNAEVTLYVNEQANCRWSTTPLAYEDMDQTKECKTKGLMNSMMGYYECTFNADKKIVGIGGSVGDVKYAYFKCQDLSAKKNTNKDPYTISFKGSEKLNITAVSPSGDIWMDLNKQNLTIEVDTVGGASGNGESTCKYTQQESLKNSINSMDDTMDAYGSVHKKVLTGISSGAHVIYFGCTDKAGNVAYNQTSFTILSDTTAPIIAKYYWSDETLGYLVFVTSEIANCEYSTINAKFKLGEGSATLKDGTTHETAESSSVYYVICTDMFNNSNTSPYIFRRI